jgi:hypothetical protein
MGSGVSWCVVGGMYCVYVVTQCWLTNARRYKMYTGLAALLIKKRCRVLPVLPDPPLHCVDVRIPPRAKICSSSSIFLRL